LKPDEIAKLTEFFRAKFEMPSMSVKKRPQKDDSAEVYIGEEFIGVVFEDEDEAGSYMFEMAILSEDLPR